MVDDDIGVGETHLGMYQPARWIGDQHAALKAEGTLQPFERRPRITVEHADAKGGMLEGIVHGRISIDRRSVL
ncbi:hypothetical protein [Mesorhizobium amorphae]